MRFCSSMAHVFSGDDPRCQCGESDRRRLTGVHDREGVEIKEGDIIWTNHEMKHRPTGKRYTVVRWVMTRYKVGFNIGSSNDNKCVIVGNIIDNPELQDRERKFNAKPV